MASHIFTTDREFEDDVRRIARLIWPSVEDQGSATISGRERDGVFITEEMVHLIECTTSRKTDKATYDSKKIHELEIELRRVHPEKGIKGWFVTLDEPTAEQRKIVQAYKGSIVAISYDQFRSKLIDAKTYLNLRKEYAFGSIVSFEPDGASESVSKLGNWPGS